MKLTNEQVEAVVEWMQSNGLSNGTVGKFKRDFIQIENTEKKEEKSVNIEDVLSGFIKMGYDVFGHIPKMYVINSSNTSGLDPKVVAILNNRKEELSDIKIGDKVKLKGDANSPTMTVIGNSSQDARIQIGRGYQDDIIQSNDILKCAYFVREEDDETRFKPMQTVEIHKNALEKQYPTLPKNGCSEIFEIEKMLKSFLDEKTIEIASNDKHNTLTIGVRKDLGLTPNYHTVNSIKGASAFIIWLKESLEKRNAINWN